MKPLVIANTLLVFFMLPNIMNAQNNPFVPDDFNVPEKLENEYFTIRMLTVNDVVKDYDALIYMWVRESEFAGGLDSILFHTVKEWINKDWPFNKVAYPGRTKK